MMYSILVRSRVSVTRRLDTARPNREGATSITPPAERVTTQSSPSLLLQADQLIE
jgi:hypothetical protein